MEDLGDTLITEIRLDQHSLIAGLFDGVLGMRRLEIAPHLAFA